MVDAQRIDVVRAHRQHELRCVRSDRGAVRDARQHGVDVVVGHEVGRGREDLVERRVEVGQLRGQHRCLATPSPLCRRLPYPAHLVDAPAIAFGLTPVLHDRGPRKAEEGADLREQPDVVLAVRVVRLDRGQDVIRDQRSRALDLECLHDRDARELPGDPRQVAEHHRGRPEVPQQGLGGRTDAQRERRLTDMPRDDRVVEHDGSGLEEGDLLRVRAPLALVAELSLAAHLAGELEETAHTPVTPCRGRTPR